MPQTSVSIIETLSHHLCPYHPLSLDTSGLLVELSVLHWIPADLPLIFSLLLTSNCRCCLNGSWPGACPRLLPATLLPPAQPSPKSRLSVLLKSKTLFRYSVYLASVPSL